MIANTTNFKPPSSHTINNTTGTRATGNTNKQKNCADSSFHSRSGPGPGSTHNNNNMNNTHSGYTHLYHNQQQQQIQQQQQLQAKARSRRSQPGDQEKQPQLVKSNPNPNPGGGQARGLTKVNQSYSDSLLFLHKPQQSITNFHEIARPHLNHHNSRDNNNNDRDQALIGNRNKNEAPIRLKKPTKSTSETGYHRFYNYNDHNPQDSNNNPTTGSNKSKSKSSTTIKATPAPISTSVSLNSVVNGVTNNSKKGSTTNTSKAKNKAEKKISTNSTRLIQQFPHKFCSDQDSSSSSHNNNEPNHSQTDCQQQQQQPQRDSVNLVNSKCKRSTSLELVDIRPTTTTASHQQFLLQEQNFPPTVNKFSNESHDNIIVNVNGSGFGDGIQIELGGKTSLSENHHHHCDRNENDPSGFLIQPEPYFPTGTGDGPCVNLNNINTNCYSSASCSELYPQYPHCTQQDSHQSEVKVKRLTRTRTAQDLEFGSKSETDIMLTSEMLKKPLSLMEQKKLQWAKEKEELNGLWSPWGRPDPQSTSSLNISGTSIMNSSSSTTTTSSSSTYLNKQQSSSLQSECHLPPIPIPPSQGLSLSSRSGQNLSSMSGSHLFSPPPQQQGGPQQQQQQQGGPKSLWTTASEIDKESVAMRLSRKTGLPICINATTGEVHYNNLPTPNSNNNHSGPNLGGIMGRGRSSPGMDDSFVVNSAVMISSNNQLSSALTTTPIKYDYHQSQSQNKLSTSTLSLADTILGKQQQGGGGTQQQHRLFTTSTNTTKATGRRKGEGGGGGTGWTSSLDEEAFTSSGYQSEANGFLSNGEDYGYHSRNGSGDGPRCESSSTRKSDSPGNPNPNPNPKGARRNNPKLSVENQIQSQSSEDDRRLTKMGVGVGVGVGGGTVITQEDYRNALSSSGSGGGGSKKVVVHNINVESLSKRSICQSPPSFFNSGSQHEGQGDSILHPNSNNNNNNKQYNNKTKHHHHNNNTATIQDTIHNTNATNNNNNNVNNKNNKNNTTGHHPEKSHQRKSKTPPGSKTAVATESTSTTSTTTHNFKNPAGILPNSTPAAMRSSIPVGLDSSTHTESYKNIQKMEKQKWLDELDKQREEQRVRKQMEKDEKRPKWGDKGVGVGHFWDPSSVDDHLPQPSREQDGSSVTSAQQQFQTPAWLEKGLSRIQNSVSQPSLFNPSSSGPGQQQQLPQQQQQQQPQQQQQSTSVLSSSEFQGPTHTQSSIDLRNVVGLGDFNDSDNLNESQRNYLRGQNVPPDPDISAEKDKKRRAALEHQEAIRKQIEERQLRLKQEKEKRLQEEMADEEKIKMQRLRELEQLELETRKLGYYNSGDDPDDVTYEYNDMTETADVRRAIRSRDSQHHHERVQSGRRLSLDGSPLIGILSEAGGPIPEPNYLTNSQSMINVSRQYPQYAEVPQLHNREETEDDIEPDNENDCDRHFHSDNVHSESRPLSNRSSQRSRSLSHHREIGIQTETGGSNFLGVGGDSNHLNVKNSHKHRSHNCLMKGGGGGGGGLGGSNSNSKSKLMLSTGDDSSDNPNNNPHRSNKKLEKPRWGATQTKKQYVKQSEKDPLYQQRLKRRMDRLKRFEDRINGGGDGGGGGSSGGGGPGFSGDTGTGTESEEHSSSNNNNNNNSKNQNQSQSHAHTTNRARGRSPPPGRFRSRNTLHNSTNNNSTALKKQGPLKATARIPPLAQSQPPVSTRSSKNMNPNAIPTAANASSSGRAKKIFPDIPGRTIGPLKPNLHGPDFDGIIGSYGIRGGPSQGGGHGRQDGGESSANSNSSRYSSPSLDLDTMSLSSKNVQTHTHSYYMQEEQRTGTGLGGEEDLEIDLESRIITSSCRSVEIHYEDTRSVKSTDSVHINSTTTSTTTSKNHNQNQNHHNHNLQSQQKSTIIEESSDEVTYMKTSTSKTVIGHADHAPCSLSAAKAKAKMMAEHAQDFIHKDMEMEMRNNAKVKASRAQKEKQKQHKSHSRKQQQQQQQQEEEEEELQQVQQTSQSKVSRSRERERERNRYDGYENDYNDDNDDPIDIDTHMSNVNDTSTAAVATTSTTTTTLPKIVSIKESGSKSKANKRKPMTMTISHSPSSLQQNPNPNSKSSGNSKSQQKQSMTSSSNMMNSLSQFGPNSIPITTSGIVGPNNHFSITNRLGSPPVPALLKKLQAGIPIEDFGVCDDLLYEIPRAPTAGSSSNSAGYKSAETESDTSHASAEAPQHNPSQSQTQTKSHHGRSKSRGQKSGGNPPLISRSRLSSSGGLEIDIDPSYALSSIHISNTADDTSNILSPPSPPNYFGSAEDQGASTEDQDQLQRHPQNPRQGHSMGQEVGVDIDIDSNYPDGDMTDQTKDDPFYGDDVEDEGRLLDIKDPYYADEESVRNSTSFEEETRKLEERQRIMSYGQQDSTESGTGTGSGSGPVPGTAINLGMDRLERDPEYDDEDYLDDTYNDSLTEVDIESQVNDREMQNNHGRGRGDGDRERDRDRRGRDPVGAYEDEDHEEEADEEEDEEEESASVSLSLGGVGVGGAGDDEEEERHETGVKERDIEFYGEPIYPYPIPIPKHIPTVPSPSPQLDPRHRSSPTTTVPARPRVSGRTTTLEVMADYRSFHLPDYDYDNLKLIPHMEIGGGGGDMSASVQSLRRPSTQDTDLSKREKLISYVINNKDVQAQISARDSELSEKGIIEFNVRLPTNPQDIYAHVQGESQGSTDNYDNYKDPLMSERRRATIRWLYSSDSSSASNNSSKDSVLAHLSYLKKGIQQQQQEWNVIPSDTEDTAEESLSRSHHHSGSTVDISSEDSKYSALS